MKNSILLICLVIALSASGQVLKVRSVDKVSTPRGHMTNQVAAISPEGDYVLLCSQSQEGLVLLDLETGTARVLTTARGAGFGTKVSDDASTIAFQEVTMGEDHLLMRSVKSIDLKTASTATILPPTRELQGFDLQGNAIATITGNAMRVKSTDGRNVAAKRPVAGNSNLKLLINVNGTTRQFTPNGEQYSYLWASISPNGKRVLYYVSELGCYSCRMDGGDMIALGDLRAPQWLDDNTVVGMRDKDNGYTITSSAIIAKTLDGAEQTLTNEHLIALYPQVAARAGKIAFSTLEGDIYIINFIK